LVVYNPKAETRIAIGEDFQRLTKTLKEQVANAAKDN
jgi:hypothetical protein